MICNRFSIRVNHQLKGWSISEGQRLGVAGVKCTRFVIIKEISCNFRQLASVAENGSSCVVGNTTDVESN